MVRVNNSNPNRPAESIMFSRVDGDEDYLGGFDSQSPFSCCRLCGALYQHPDDRRCKSFLDTGQLIEHKMLNGESYFTGSQLAVVILDECTSRRQSWRLAHEAKYHTVAEIEAFAKTGYALTPEAAHKLAPYGITPLGNMSEEIVDALYTAPRKPNEEYES